MIQIYSPGNTEYEENGDMPIFPTKAEISATLNGTWKVDIEHPIDKTGRWKYIQEDALVKLPSFNGDQLFRIRNKKKASSGITATAEPVFMDSMYDCFLTDVRPTAKNGQEALDIMTAPNAKYSGKSNITRVTTAYYEYKNLIEAINGEDDNSFINRWGGEILFNNFEIIINERVGGDYGVTLQYGRNIQKNGITENVDLSGVVTRIYPKAYNGYKLSGSGYVDSPVISSYPIVKAATITFDDVKMAEDAQDSDAENGIIICNSQEELDTALRQKCNDQFSAGIDKPTVNITANMVLLQNTRQYKNYAVLEQVSLGDTIHCKHTKLGITTDARVISLKYDAIKKKVTYVELGDFTYNYFSNVNSAIDRIEQVIRPNGTVMADKIAGFIDGAATSLRAQYDVAKKQDVMAILFENLDEYSTLYGAMGLGTQGLMISKTRTADGRGWDWTTAMTANGLLANIIVAGILSDKTGKNYWNLDTGEFSLSATGFTVDGKTAEDYFKDTWSQEDVFNKLTQNGADQGIYMKNGILYINAKFMKIGKITDSKGANYWDLDTGEFSLSSMATVGGNKIALDEELDQQGVFNRLTNYGVSQGIILKNGQLYINASYIASGQLRVGGLNNQDGEILVYNGSNGLIGSWNSSGFMSKGKYFAVDTDGQVYATVFSCTKLKMAPTPLSDILNINTIKSTRSTVIQTAGYASGSGASGMAIYIGKSGSEDSQETYEIIFGKNNVTNRITVYGNTYFQDDMRVYGQKNRIVKTENYGERLMCSYETTSPMFGDIGTAVTDENGECVIEIDNLFYETVSTQIEYQVFLQKEGFGDIWISKKEPTYFVVEGSPNLKFSWEIKAKQKGYEYNRIESGLEKEPAPNIEKLLPLSYVKNLEEVLLS